MAYESARNDDLCVGVLVSTSAFAETPMVSTNDAGPVAKVSLDTAVTAAERHVQGKAVRAEYEKEKEGQWRYDVEVRAGTRVFDVKVDPGTGEVIASTEDKLDADDDGDAAD
jgi:uncharacterized membrane protein YkoI